MRGFKNIFKGGGGMSNGYLSLPGGPRNIMVILQYKEK